LKIFKIEYEGKIKALFCLELIRMAATGKFSGLGLYYSKIPCAKKLLLTAELLWNFGLKYSPITNSAG
jgi:hypothetical protein